jgi:DNA-binding NarL/FixJ family response regulator
LMLNLSESTINDHIARLIVKTNARNRIQMAATLLGWSAARTSDAPSSRRTDD